MRKSVLTSLYCLFSIVSGSACSVDDVNVWLNNQKFSNDIASFAVSCLGNGGRTVGRLSAVYPTISETCYSCFATLVSCGARECFRKCAFDNTTPECIKCSKDKCQPGFKSCSGIEDDSLLPLNPIKGSITTTASPTIVEEPKLEEDIVESVTREVDTTESTVAPETIVDTQEILKITDKEADEDFVELLGLVQVVFGSGVGGFELEVDGFQMISNEEAETASTSLTV